MVYQAPTIAKIGSFDDVTLLDKGDSTQDGITYNGVPIGSL